MSSCDLFISYSSADAGQAFALADRLRRRGFSLWIDKEGIGGATSWSKEIAEAIVGCKVLVVLLSAESVKSEHVCREVLIAAEKQKAIIPVDLERVELPSSLLYPLAGIQRVPHANEELLWKTLERFGIKSAPVDTNTGSEFSPLPPDPYGRKSLAVLPFENLSSDPEDRWFAEGLTHELINVLSQIKALRVKDRKSVGSYNTTGKSLSRIADELGVEYILEGTVRKAGDKLRATAELIDVRHDDHLWSDTFKGTLDDIFDLQERIATEIAAALKLTLTLEEQSNVGKRLTDNLEAYEAYVKAEEIAAASFTAYEEVLRYANSALALDPRFSEAWAMKARALNGMVMNLGFPLRFADEARDAATTALKYYPHSARAFVELAHAQALLGNSDEALRARARGVELDSNDSYVLMKAGVTLAIVGDFRAALADFERGRTIRPDDISLIVNEAWAASSAGDHTLIQSLIESSLPFMEREITLHPEDVTYLAFVVWALAISGQKEEALSQTTALQQPPDDPYSAAVCALGLFACDLIDEGFEVALAAPGVIPLVRYTTMLPQLEWIRDDPRYALLEERKEREIEELAAR
jgi:adenylate cyclase